jgi:hypothetical protein
VAVADGNPLVTEVFTSDPRVLVHPRLARLLVHRPASRYHHGVLAGGSSHRCSGCVDRLFHTAGGRIERVRRTTEGLAGT